MLLMSDPFNTLVSILKILSNLEIDIRVEFSCFMHPFEARKFICLYNI